MPNKSRQQNQNVKARKAKVRAQVKKEYRSWIDRSRYQAKKSKPHPSVRASISETVPRMFAGTGPGGSLTPADRERNERTLCRIMGEPFRID